MHKLTPCLWFDFNADEAVEHYLGIFKNGKVLDVTHYGDAVPSLKGKVLTLEFVIEGQHFMALNAGPQFPFTEAISIAVDCDDQAEVDRLWTRLSEGGSTNVYMVGDDGVIRTRTLKANILAGVTRLNLLSVIAESGLEIREDAFTLDEATAAREVFVTAATSLVLPIIAIDRHVIGTGTPGPVALSLRDSYIDKARRTAGV